MNTTAWAFYFALFILMAIAFRPAHPHDIYSDWKTREGWSCCHEHDCAPATAWQDTEGHWFTRQNGATYTVAPDAVLPIQSPDGRSHACIRGGRVICLVPGEVRG